MIIIMVQDYNIRIVSCIIIETAKTMHTSIIILKLESLNRCKLE